MEQVTRYKCQMKGCPLVSAIEAPVCEDHMQQIGQIYLETRSVAGTFLWMREEIKRKREASIAQAQVEAARGPLGTFAETVYYVRIGDHVKIGTTNDLHARLRSLYVDHDPKLLMAVEPGGLGVERHRHGQFQDERVWRNRELFNPSRRLLGHIEQLREQHGDPSVLLAAATN